MDLEQWKKLLSQIDRSKDPQWLERLDSRKREEIEFHDKNRDRLFREDLESHHKEEFNKFYGNKKYYAQANLSKDYLFNWIIEHGRGKIILEYACGNGKHAILAAKNGAALAIGIDISPISVENARKDAEAAGVSDNTFFLVADAEDTRFPANSIDAIVCCGVLHHLDLSRAIPEIQRILAHDAVALAFEALSYNPLIRLYRKLTPQMRTSWERDHILNYRDIRLIRKFLEVSNIKFWHIVGILSPHMKPLAPLLNRIDRFLTRLPLIQLMSWIFTFEMKKR